jgi:hypothetical protein
MHTVGTEFAQEYLSVFIYYIKSRLYRPLPVQGPGKVTYLISLSQSLESDLKFGIREHIFMALQLNQTCRKV